MVEPCCIQRSHLVNMATAKNVLSMLLFAWAVAACCRVSAMRPPASLGARARLPGEVTQLPGLHRNLPSKHFAGYVTVDSAARRQLYYYLVSAEQAPAAPLTTAAATAAAAATGAAAGGPHAADTTTGTPQLQQQQQKQQLRPALAALAAQAPLVLWLTGGPGCSSMDAFTYENGPFTFSFASESRSSNLEDILLTPNPHTWSKAAHVLYVDSPAGTGLSYTEGAASYATNDTATIEDLYAFLVGWLEQYPEFKGRPLYLAGESYAGIYVPLLARRIVRAQKQHRSQAAAAPTSQAPSATATAAAPVLGAAADDINLQGYIIGNGVTDDRYDSNSQVDFAWGMGLLDPITYASVQATCHGVYWNASRGSKCDRALQHMEQVLGDINPYDTLEPCVWAGHNEAAAASAVAGAKATKQLKARSHHQQRQHGEPPGRWQWLSSSLRSLQQHVASQQADVTAAPQLDAEISAQGAPAAASSAAAPAAAGGQGSRRQWPFAAAFDRSQPLRNWWQAHKQLHTAQQQQQQQEEEGVLTMQGQHLQASSQQQQQQHSRGAAGRRRTAPKLGHTIACADRRHSLIYYNSPAVRRAIHAAPVEVAGRWEPCSDVLSYTSDVSSVIEVHKELLASGVRGLVLSGDHDYVVPFTGTREWVWGLGLQVEEGWGWGPWHTPDGQVAGYAVRFQEGLTFATVKGGGHMVPQTQPAASQHMLGLWLQGQL